MARHRDINMASSLLEGAQGWIIENHPEAITDPNKKRTRRSKKKCPIIIMDSVNMHIPHVWELIVVHILKRLNHNFTHPFFKLCRV